MLVSEAVWIGSAMSALPVDVISPCLNLGSSTAHFRKITQPCIEQYIIAPGEARGMRFIHADIKEAPGVDAAGDIYDPTFRTKLIAFAPGSVLCCNMFEHVRDRRRLADICIQLVRPGGYIIVSVPKSFPYHLDPIDTNFRPSPAEIAELFSECEIVASDIVLDTTYWKEVSQLSLRERLMTLAKIGIHIFLPFYKYERWKSRMHPLLWLFRRYSVSIVVLKRVVQDAQAA